MWYSHGILIITSWKYTSFYFSLKVIKEKFGGHLEANCQNLCRGALKLQATHPERSKKRPERRRHTGNMQKKCHGGLTRHRWDQSGLPQWREQNKRQEVWQKKTLNESMTQTFQQKPSGLQFVILFRTSDLSSSAAMVKIQEPPPLQQHLI